MIKIDKILFPTDFSELADAALKYAVQFATDYQAELHVIHVVDEAYQYWMSMGPSSVPVGAPITDDVIRTSRKAMEQLVASKIPSTLKITSEVLSGRPYFEIVTYAKEKEIDMIVVGTHGRGGLTHMLLGSVAEKVVRKAPCPVLIVHHPEHEFVLP